MCSREVVILVGRQGAGKTHYCLTELADHHRISQDEGPRQFERLFRRYQKALAEGVVQIVVDRTNPTVARRNQFVYAAREHGYRVKIIYFDVPRQLCEQRIRDRKGHPTLSVEKMTEAINRYEQMLEPPTQAECDELIIIRESMKGE